MKNFTILAGGAGNFISSYVFNPVGETLTLTNNYTSGLNPSWIASSRVDDTVFYAVNEDDPDVSPGAVQSFQLGAFDAPIATISSGGDVPAHLLVLPDDGIFVANYFGANTEYIEPQTNSTVGQFGSSAVLDFSGAKEGVESHPHASFEYGDELLVPDLGADRVYRLTKQEEAYSIAGWIEQPEGSGPRHVLVVDDLLYTIHETSSTVTIQAIPPLGETNESPILAQASTLPDGLPNSTFGASEILIPTPNEEFPTQYIYASNRNTGDVFDERGDSIAIMQYVNGELKVIKHFFPGFQQVRGMEFGGDSLEYLATGGGVAGGVGVFKRINGGADFIEVAKNGDVDTRQTFLWV
ncbi:hypothetical protein CYLTODRAFT_344283 [Cylindrobasidium torrendii FP15055 ss-10]|uniref:Isomerase YbhE n=1 Tax=Cylindrobasidium torrendii FP15055 ss-10 TaxID=1314674 RepID=A0A0D7BRL1_9AGAR|nr:hypothetical protein CYLTODRAFT_344283 [Cylindrobasidium torrendii FP15055 ss-10]